MPVTMPVLPFNASLMPVFFFKKMLDCAKNLVSTCSCFCVLSQVIYNVYVHAQGYFFAALECIRLNVPGSQTSN